jgi:hypothetical protein
MEAPSHDGDGSRQSRRRFRLVPRSGPQRTVDLASALLRELSRLMAGVGADFMSNKRGEVCTYCPGHGLVKAIRPPRARYLDVLWDFADRLACMGAAAQTWFNALAPRQIIEVGTRGRLRHGSFNHCTATNHSGLAPGPFQEVCRLRLRATRLYAGSPQEQLFVTNEPALLYLEPNVSIPDDFA